MLPQQKVSVMQIESGAAEKVVEDYDIAMLDGMLLTLTLDAALQDVFEWGPDVLHVVLTEKENPTQPGTKLPAEEVWIERRNVLSVRRRTRNVLLPSAEEKEAWKATVKELTERVH